MQNVLLAGNCLPFLFFSSFVSLSSSTYADASLLSKKISNATTATNDY